MKTKRMQLMTAVVLCLFCSTALNAQTFKKEIESSKRATSRDITIERIDNDRADFAVLVEVDKTNYVEDSLLIARVKSSRDGYIYMIHFSSTGEETVLIPNDFQKDNRIKANQVVQYPPPGKPEYRFRITGPNFGRETIKVIVTDRPLESIDLKKYSQAKAKSLEPTDSVSLLAELIKSKDIVVERVPPSQGPTQRQDDQTKPRPTSQPEVKLQFATHQVSFTTRAGTQTPSQTQTQTQTAKPQRYAVCIAPEKYLDPKINDLSVCVHDANAFAKLMKTKCGVPEDNCVILVNEQVTLENIKKLFCEVLPKIVPPGSELIIYWSGHGGRMAAVRTRDITVTSSPSSYTSYLVPHDGKTSDPENTMLLEGAFGHWVQNLNGRKLLFILDACYSGAITQRAKSLDNNGETKPQSLAGAVSELTGGSKSIDPPEDGDDFEITFDLEEDFVFTFGFESLARSKALGQKGLAVIASSSRDQLSWERNEGNLSVMTYYLIKAIEEGPRTMTHKHIKPAISKVVDDYVRANHPNTRQTVVEQDDLTPGMRLKP